MSWMGYCWGKSIYDIILYTDNKAVNTYACSCHYFICEEKKGREKKKKKKKVFPGSGERVKVDVFTVWECRERISYHHVRWGSHYTDRDRI